MIIIKDSAYNAEKGDSMKKKAIFLFLCALLLHFTLSLPSTSQIAKKVIVSYGDILNEPVKHINPDKPMVALTFDDGPTRKYTTMILDCLKENHCYATFFVLGSRIEKAPDLLERMILEGNEIGNHTYSHKQLTKLNETSIINEINDTNEKIYEATHIKPNVLRPPYGEYNETVINHLGEMKIITWNVDSEDWRSKNAEIIYKKVIREVQNGSIILLHDLYLSSAQAACLLIPALVEEGYQLVTVSDLYTYQNLS